MAENPVYLMNEPDSNDFKGVCIVRQYLANAGANNFEIAVADVGVTIP